MGSHSVDPAAQMSWMNQLVRFVGVGGISTLCDYLVFGVLEFFGLHPAVATGFGYFVGAVVNYSLNYRFTFKADVAHRKAIPKFALVASIGLALNVGLVWLMFDVFEIHAYAAKVLATLLVLVYNFIANKFWTFGAK